MPYKRRRALRRTPRRTLPACYVGQPEPTAKPDLLDHTRRVFQHRTSRRLSDEDCREIRANIVGFFTVLAEWDAKAKTKATTDTGGRRDG